MLEGFKTLFSDSATLLNAEEWLTELDYSASKKSPIAQEQKERLQQVKEILIDLLPDVTGIRFTQPSKQQRIPRVEFETPYGWVPLRGIGYGYQTLIAWVVDLAARMIDRYPESKHPLHEPAVVLVDEIDLHLHPSWQQKVMRYLSDRFPNTQFIATAHSPLIVQAAPGVKANVAVLRREEDYVIIDNDPAEVRGWRVDQILMSDLYNVSSRSPEIQALLDERNTLLSKPKLNKHDKLRIKELERKIGPLPVGETPEDIRTMELLRETLDVLQGQTENSA